MERSKQDQELIDEMKRALNFALSHLERKGGEARIICEEIRSLLRKAG